MADATVSMQWGGEGLAFEGGAPDGPRVRVDGDGRNGAKPTELLLLSLGGCMGADIVDILAKMRVPLEALELRLEGDRASEPPRRYTRIRIICTTRGVSEGDAPKLDRAVALSSEKYCSVLHTLRPDCEITTEIRRD